MKVYELAHRTRLLVGSGGGSTEDYNNGGSQSW